MGGAGRASPVLYFDPEQVAFATKERAFSDRLVALHFARGLRQLLDDPLFRAAIENLPKDGTASKWPGLSRGQRSLTVL